MLKSPLFHVAVSSTHRTKLFFLLYMSLSLFCALSEGLTFSFLLLAITIQAAGGATPADFISQKIIHVLPWELSFLSCFFLAILTQVIRTLAMLTSGIVFVRISTSMQEAVQKVILKKIFSFNFPFVNRFRAGELSDIACLPANCLPIFISNINAAFFSLVMSMAILVFMLSISVPLTLTTVGLFTLSGLVYKVLGRILASHSKSFSGETATLSSEIVESIGAMRYVHYYQNGALILEKLGIRIRKLIHSLKRALIWNASIATSSELLATVFMGILLLIGSIFYPIDGAGASVLLVFLGASYRSATRIQGFITALGTILLNWGHVVRMNAFLKEEGQEFLPLGGRSLPQRKQTIRFENVSLRYPGKSQNAIHDLSLEIPFGTTIGFAGTSGAGKSTLLDLLIRLYEPTSGKITIEGEKTSDIDLHSWRNLFGIVNQDIFLFNDSIESNLRFGKANATREEIEEAAKLAGAHSFILRLPQGYHTLIGERGTRLSGGERQRIAIARALVRNPQILVLDEATSSLDTETEKVIQNCLETLQGMKTVIIVAHRLSTLIHADHIYVIDEGQIIEQGTHSQLLAHEGKYAALWRLQSSHPEQCGK